MRMEDPHGSYSSEEAAGGCEGCEGGSGGECPDCYQQRLEETCNAISNALLGGDHLTAYRLARQWLGVAS